MKKIILIFTLILGLMFSCSTQKKCNEIVFGSSMSLSYELSITNNQLDSICNVDKLPNLDKWASAKFTDYETNTKCYKRMVIKKIDDTSEFIYILVGNEEPYKITRRISEK